MMTKEEIIEMARQSGLIAPSAVLQEGRTHDRAIEAFAKLAFEKGRQQGMQQERVLWELSKLSQE